MEECRAPRTHRDWRRCCTSAHAHEKLVLNPEGCLPPHLRGPSTTITKISTGLSGAAVYRVESPEQLCVLKIAQADDLVDEWHRKLDILQSAASAGLAPRVIHVDDASRAVVTEHVADQFIPRFMNPQTREATVAEIGRTLHRVHALPLPPTGGVLSARDFLGVLWSGLAGFTLPPFVRDSVRDVLAAEPPPRERATALCHNDVNPSNLVHDGQRLLLLDWNTAGPNDPLYDLAAISVFLRFDDDMCRRLLGAYDGERPFALSPGFLYNRWLVAVLAGAMFFTLARTRGHPGAAGDETLDASPSLGDCYQRMQAGTLDIGSGAGQWWFGLAMFKDARKP
jgi:aminoglycoside phosphotransferase (APT) family kinase protein